MVLWPAETLHVYPIRLAASKCVILIRFRVLTGSYMSCMYALRSPWLGREGRVVDRLPRLPSPYVISPLDTGQGVYPGTYHVRMKAGSRALGSACTYLTTLIGAIPHTYTVHHTIIMWSSWGWVACCLPGLD